MARVAIPILTLQGSVNPPFGGAEWMATPVNSDGTNDHEWEFLPGDILLCYNTDVGGRNTTLKATLNSQERLKDSSQTVGAESLGVFGPLSAEGWVQADGKVYVDCFDVTGVIKYLVIRGAQVGG